MRILVLSLVMTSLDAQGQKVTLEDGSQFTGLDIHLPVSTLSPVRAYLGIQYASLGVRKTKNQTSSLLFTKTSLVSSPTVAIHRLSQSVASFFYGTPKGVQSKTTMPAVCPQPFIDEVESAQFPGIIQNRLRHLKTFLNSQSEECLTLNIYVPNIGRYSL